MTSIGAEGRGSLENLRELKGSRAVLVLGGGSMKRGGFVDRAVAYLAEACIEPTLFENAEPDPSVETVMAGAKLMREVVPDWIVSMDDGSPIDAAKAIWAFCEYPEIMIEELITPFNFPELRKKARFCTIASTSGPATEVTTFSVITDHEKGIKYPLADFNIMPDVAIVDPDLPATMPQKLVAYTGMDALTHAIEAYTSTAHCDFNDPLALKAVEMVNDHLKKSYDGDMLSRERMHYGQCMAGMAFSNTLLGIVHSMAHKTGAAFSTGHITHGLANALYLPYVIAYNAVDPATAEHYGQIEASIGLEPTVKALVDFVEDLNAYMNMPNTLGALASSKMSSRKRSRRFLPMPSLMCAPLPIRVQLTQRVWNDF